MTKMLWIVPARSRPDNIARLISLWQTTRVMADLLVVCDEDDPELDAYEKVDLNFQGFPWVRFELEPRMMISGKLNKWAVREAEHYDVIGFMGDDHLPKTPVWDGLMAEQLRRMGTGIVYGNDLFQSANLPTSVAMTSNIIKALGYMVPPTIQHLYIDNFWLTLGREADCIEYMEHVIIEHIHPHAGKAEGDEQYDRVNSTEQYNRDSNAFKTYTRKGLADDVAKIRQLGNNFNHAENS